MNELEINRLFQKARIVSGAIVFAIGLIASIGWIVGLPELNRISPKFIPMAQDTGLSFILIGIMLLYYRRSNDSLSTRTGAILLTGMLSGYGLLKVLGYLTGADWTFSNVLLPTTEHLGTYALNRMSPIAGALFFISGAAILAMQITKREGRVHYFAGWIGAGVFGVGSLMTYGYVLGAPFLYNGKIIPLSFLTSIAFCFLGIGLIAVSGPESILKPFLGQSTKSRILRLIVPLVVLTCFAQQTFHELSSATELNRTVVLVLTPLAAALIAALTGGRLAEHLSNRLNAANQLLEESEEKYRTAIEHSHDMFWTLDLGGKFLFANKRCAEVTGYEVSEWIGRSFVDILSPKDLPRVHTIFLKVLGGEPQQYEVEAIRADRSNFYLEIASVPEFRHGKVIGVASFGRDITERKEVEFALSKSEALLRESQSVAGIGSYDLDIQTGYWTSSVVLDEIMGIDSHFQRTVEGWVSLIHPDWRETMVVYFQTEVIGKQQRFNKDYKLVRPSDGKECWVHGLGALVFDEQGKPIRMIGTIQDITEQKKAEAERENLESKLRQARKMETIGTLAGGVAHDFNNILTPILVYSDMAALELGEDHPLRSDLEQIIAGANRAKDLVKQILTFSRQMDNEQIPVALSPIVKEVLKLFQVSLPPNIKVVTNIKTEGTEVRGDPSQIHQVLLNLCTNAHHAMRKGGGTLNVSLENVTLSDNEARNIPPLSKGEYVRLTVSDSGCGMNETTRERIFEPFFTTKPVDEGTGLGLSVVHGIVKSHDGAIAVKSEVNIGTTFDIYFPKLRTSPSVSGQESKSIRGGNERVLVVDDDPSVADVIKGALERYLGYQVTVCTSSLEALELVRHQPHRFDLLLTDQKMPTLTGVQLAQEVSKICNSMPVILMTGYSEIADEAKCKELGISGFLMKPPDTSELARVVRKALDASQLENPASKIDA
ncbi:MAG: PAS domain S-box protein [bacterium]|nr:PAS domain S-box protein [bacterium]